MNLDRLHVLQTTHELPAPMTSEAERRTRAAKARAEMEARGGRVVSERLIRNPVFDRRGEKTTTQFVVEWPDEP